MISVALEKLLVASNSGYWGRDPGATGEVVRVIRNGDVKPGKGLTGSYAERSLTRVEVEKARLRAGDLVITTSGDCGVTGFIETRPDEVTCASNFIRILRPDVSQVHPKYLFHFTRSQGFRSALAPYIRGTTLKNLSSKDALAATQVPLPPLEQQRRIADVLDQADDLVAKRLSSLVRLRELDESVFAEMFLGRTFAKYPLRELVDADDRINYGVVQPGQDVHDGIPLIRVSNLRGGVVERSNLKMIHPGIDAKHARSRLRGTEILLSCVGSIGTVSVASEADIGSNIARAVTRVPISNSALRTYVAAFLRTARVQGYFASEVRTVTQPTLNGKQIGETPVPVPPTSLLQDFEQYVSESSRNRRRLEESLVSLKAAIDAIRASEFASSG